MNKAIITKRFEKHHCHDALLKGIHIEPAGDRRSKSVVQVVLEDYDTDELILITFVQPGNISFVGDFDVLLDNAGFGNTSRTKASLDRAAALRTISAHKKKWNIKYDAGVKSPIERKTKQINKYAVYKILFFGGTLEVLASNFHIKRFKNKSQLAGRRRRAVRRVIGT
jgi:hypothetical protein